MLAVEQQGLQVAAGGRALHFRPRVLDERKEGRLPLLAQAGELRPPEFEDIAPEMALAVDNDEARRGQGPAHAMSRPVRRASCM